MPVQRLTGRRKKHYNYFRDYDTSIGRYIESDPIGLRGGSNTFAYVFSSPLSYTDMFGLQRGNGGPPAPATYYSRGRVNYSPMSYQRPANAFEAAGYYDLDLNFICLRWNCPVKPFQCSMYDKQTSNDFIPPATDSSKPPDGCACDEPRFELVKGGASFNDVAQGLTAYGERGKGFRLTK